MHPKHCILFTKNLTHKYWFMKKFISFSLLLTFLVSGKPMFSQKAALLIPTGHSNNIGSLSFSPDDRYIFSSSNDGIKIWQASDYKLIKKMEDEFASAILPHPVDKNLVILVSSKEVRFFDINRFEIVKRIANDSIKMGDAVTSPDGRYLYVAGISKANKPSMLIWRLNLSDFSFEKVFEHFDASMYNVVCTNLSINSSGTELLVNDHNYNSYLIDGKQRKLIKTISWQKAKVKTFTPDDQLLAIDDPSGFLDFKVMDRNSENTLWQVKASRKGAIVNYRKTYLWNKKNNHFIIGTNGDLIEVDFKNQQLIRAFKLPDENNNLILTMNSKGSLILAGTAKFIEKPSLIMVYDASTFNKLAEVGLSPFTSWDLQSYHKSKKIASISLNGFAKNIEFRDNGLNITSEIRTGYIRNNYLAIAPDDKQLAFGSSSYGVFDLFNSPDKFEQPITITANESGGACDIFYSDDGSLIAVVSTKKTNVIDSRTGEIIKEFENGYYGITSFSSLGAFSKNKKLLVFYGVHNVNYQSVPKVVCYNLATGAKVWEKEGELSDFRFTNNDQSIVCIRKSGNTAIVTLNANTGQELNNKPLAVKTIMSTALTNDMKYLFVADADEKSDNIYQFNMSTGEQIQVYTGHTATIWGMDLLAGNEFLISGASDNTLRVWDIVLKKEVAKIILYEKNNDWVIIDPNGRFDASGGAMDELYYVYGRQIIPLEAVFEKFYTPLLLGRILNHQEMPAPDISDIKTRPTARIAYAEKQRNLEVEEDFPSYLNTSGLAELTVVATAPDDVVDEIRLFHNGKVVNLATRGLFVTENDGSDSKKYTISLLPGVNTFRAVAINTQRTESKPDEITVTYNSGSDPAPATNLVPGNSLIDPVDRSATLYLIVVGINKYQNPAMSLNYALADATAFKQELEKDAKTVLTGISTQFVTDDMATRKGIQDAFQKVKQAAKPQDVFVFYYAGHGVIGKDKEYYLVPNDVSNLKNVQTELEQKGFAAKLMQQYAIDIPAQKQLFILDACQSAGAFEAMLSNDGDQQKSIAVVARSTGTHWMAASGAQQYANEFSQLGHGAFTYVLLEALKGSAATDKMITVNGLKSYLQQGVPELMKKYNGTLQYPASYGFGNDFPVEIVK